MSYSELANILTEDWSQELKAAPDLVHILGLCTAYTARPQIMAMELSHPRLENKGLLANLVNISNQGHKAFQQAHADCYKISIYALEIGKKNGYIDKVVSSFGEKRLQKRLERALEGLDRQVTKAQREGDNTKKAFDAWQEQTSVLEVAVAEKTGATVKTLEEKQEEKALLEKNLKLAVKDKESAGNNLQNAHTSFQNASAKAKEAERYLNSFQHYASGFVTGAALGPIGAILFTAATASYINSYEQNVRSAVTNLEAHSNVLEKCKRDLFITENNLAQIEASQLTWEQICSAIKEVLGELSRLQSSVSIMVTYFSTLTLKVDELVTRYKDDFKRIIDDEDFEEESIEDLKQYSNDVKLFALAVYTLASVYSSISSQYIIPGFHQVSGLIECIPQSLSAVEQIRRSQGEMKRYSDDAKLGTTQVVVKAKFKLWDEIKKLYPDLTDDNPLNPANSMPPPYNSLGTGNLAN